jgi:hypothetical protein
MTTLVKSFASIVSTAAFCFAFTSTSIAATDNDATDASTGVSKTLPISRRAQGVAETKPSLGVIGGMTNSSDQHRTGSAIGLEYGFQPYIPYGAAVELSLADQPDQSSTLTRTKLLFKGNYNFGGNIPVIKNSYVGLGLGPVFDRLNGANDLELGVAPQIGFDIPVGEKPSMWSLGANADYLFVGGAKSQVFALNGVAKYWF